MEEFQLQQALKLSQLMIPAATSHLFLAKVNLSSFYSPPKGETSTPSLSSTTGGNWSRAEGTTRRLLASLGAVGKMSGLNTQHWGDKNIRSYCFSFQSLFSQRRDQHAAVVLPTEHIILLGGSGASRYHGEIVNGKFVTYEKKTFPPLATIIY